MPSNSSAKAPASLLRTETGVRVGAGVGDTYDVDAILGLVRGTQFYSEFSR